MAALKDRYASNPEQELSEPQRLRRGGKSQHQHSKRERHEPSQDQTKATDPV